MNMRNESEIKISDLRKKKHAMVETEEETNAKGQLCNLVSVIPEQKAMSLMEAWTDWFGESQHGAAFRTEREEQVKKRKEKDPNFEVNFNRRYRKKEDSSRKGPEKCPKGHPLKQMSQVRMFKTVN